MDYVILGIIGLALGIVIGYMFKSKKKGKSCMGCPYSGSCSGCCGGKKQENDSTDK